MVRKIEKNTIYKTSKGRDYPLGSNLQKDGVNFAITSRTAEKIFLCLFSKNGEEELAQIELTKTKDIFHVFVKGIKAEQLYAYRAHGEYNPHSGLRFNEHKLLIDPYAKEITGELIRSKANYDDNVINNASKMPKCVVTDDKFNWGKSKKPKTHLKSTFIYEAHVKGLTMLHPDIPKKDKGKFLGMCHPAIIKHLKGLNVTTIELMPVHYFISEDNLLKKGLNNYWGYNTLNYFALHNEYGTLKDFKTMVKTFHENGLEVIMDVVYNHTCEGNEEGPTYSFKGIDNKSYYILNDKNKSLYENDSGCGNTFNMDNRIALHLVIDSMLYFANECQIDGFRFDLATTLTRDFGNIGKSRFLTIIKLNKTLSNLKLIAEPWDVGLNGYQLGRFKHKFCEWNDKFREAARRFWKGDEGIAKHYVTTLSGSEDIFKNHDYGALSSINFITSHDGFTLQDLVSYEKKNNYANLENNRDGNDYNFSFNCGVEGPTKDKNIIETREKLKRNLIEISLISMGVPMIRAGDEIGNSQGGNNNSYCQDNKIGWINWDKIEKKDWDFYNFIATVSKYRLSGEKLIDYNFLTGKNVKWYSAKGTEMATEDWNNPEIKSFASLTASNIFIYNSHTKVIDFKFPFPLTGEIFLNTESNENPINKKIKDLSHIEIPDKSMILIKLDKNYIK